MSELIISLESVHEPQPGDQWLAMFKKLWPEYKTWFLSEGYKARPGYLTSVSMLQEHMPELVPVHTKLTELVGGADVEARFLSLWCPPPYLAGCSQIAWNQGGNYLLRNYDYSPDFFDGVLLYSNWLRPVIGVIDCTWGLLDGMNDAGLAVSLSFGGKKTVGEGFGIPLVIRYVLETCDTTEQAAKAFSRIPIHMSYNITVIDAHGHYATLFLGPGMEPVVTKEATCANHQEGIEWAEYAELTDTLARKEFLDICAAQSGETVHSLLGKFLSPPLYNTRFDQAFGTLYTVLYDIDKLSVEFHWPNHILRQSFDNYKAATKEVSVHAQFPTRIIV